MLAGNASTGLKPHDGAFLMECFTHNVVDDLHYFSQVTVAGTRLVGALNQWLAADAGRDSPPKAWQFVDGLWGTNPTC